MLNCQEQANIFSMAPQLVLLLFFVVLQPRILWAAQQDLNYLKFVHDASQFTPKDQHYDYIIVGGGTAGCPLAATLSEKHSVLLIERGGLAHANPTVMHESQVINNIIQTDDSFSPAEFFISEDGIQNRRGRVLGGTSMINLGFYSRGDADFYSRSGITWEMDLVKKAYEWVEETVVFRRGDIVNSWQSRAKEAMLQAKITPDNGYNLDHIEGTKFTGSTFDENGRRHGAVELLNKANPDNIHVIVNATVERVLFSSSNSSDVRAIGVIYQDSTGKSHEVRIQENGEIILSAGALGSTQLLLLSGVGPKTYLSSLNIPIVHHQPFVGQFMVDNPLNMITILTPSNSLPQGGGVGDLAAGIIKNDPYIILSVSAIIPFFSPASPIIFPYPSAPLNLTTGSFVSKITRPLSNGSLRLVSTRNVTVTPSVKFNYFSNPSDLSLCLAAMRTIGNIFNTPIMDQYKFQNHDGKKYFKFVGASLPEDLSNRGAMEALCRTTLATIYHYHGGCTQQKVTDNDFKVIGVNGLRVVDGSTFVVSPGTNPQATLLMLGRYVGLKMMETIER